MLVLSVLKEKLDIIKYFVSEKGVDVNGEFTGPIIQFQHTHTVHTHTHTVHTHTHTHVHVHIHPLTTAPVTKSGDSILVLSVREGKLDVIKYFVSEQGVSVHGEFTGPIIQAHAHTHTNTHTHTLHTNSYK